MVNICPLLTHARNVYLCVRIEIDLCIVNPESICKKIYIVINNICHWIFVANQRHTRLVDGAIRNDGGNSLKDRFSNSNWAID